MRFIIVMVIGIAIKVVLHHFGLDTEIVVDLTVTLLVWYAAGRVEDDRSRRIEHTRRMLQRRSLYVSRKRDMADCLSKQISKCLEAKDPIKSYSGPIGERIQNVVFWAFLQNCRLYLEPLVIMTGNVTDYMEFLEEEALRTERRMHKLNVVVTIDRRSFPRDLETLNE